MSSTIQLRRGPSAHLPTLASGEPAWTTDTHVLYVGDGATNHAIGGSGVSSVTASAPLASSGGATPNITHNASGVTAGSYTSANITVDADGHVTAASNGSGGGGGVTSLDSITGSVTLVAGTGVTITDNSPTAGKITIAATGGGGSGTVTSVAMTGDGTVYNSTVTGSPITTSGTLAPSLKTQTANTVLAGPSSFGTAAPTFRSLVAADLPVFGASGVSHSKGAVPDPGSTAGTTRFLREDATWAVPSGGGGGSVDNGVCEYRLTLTSGLPITTSDVSNVTTLYWTPYNGYNVALWNGSSWVLMQPGELSTTIGSNTLPTDIFVDYNSGTPTLYTQQWFSSSARAPGLSLQNGVWVYNGTPARRYVGTVTPATAGTMTDSAQFRYVWNCYNRVPRLLSVKDSAASWTYSTASYRQANGNAANLVAVCVGVSEDAIELEATQLAYQSTATAASVGVGIGLNGTTPISTAFGGQLNFPNGAQNQPAFVTARLRQIPAAGTNKYWWLENALAGAQIGVFGTVGNGRDSGMYGSILA